MHFSDVLRKMEIPPYIDIAPHLLVFSKLLTKLKKNHDFVDMTGNVHILNKGERPSYVLFYCRVNERSFTFPRGEDNNRVTFRDLQRNKCPGFALEFILLITKYARCNEDDFS
jgi:hypothetical protein